MEKELSILVKAKGALQAAGQIGKVDSAVGKLGKTAAQGVKTAGANIARLGLVAAGAVTVAVKGGIQSLAELEDATTQVQGALDTRRGLKFFGITPEKVATWANEIEASTQAAFDDKAIVSATANLIRYGKVGASNLRPAMVVMTDLAAKTGSVESASNLLAKALADPTKAAGKLAKAGVVLTKEEQKKIKWLVKTDQLGRAQALILGKVAKATRGAAAASAGPYRDSLNILSDTWEDAQRALGEGFLPVIQKVAKLLQGELAKPSTIANIREFGQGLASGLDQLIETARGLPWSTIGSSLKTAADGAKTILDTFTGLPDWIKTAVLTGWGLNKLTGGALGDMGEIAIKGVFGQFFSRGSSPANPMWVQGVGGVGGVAAGGMKITSFLGFLGFAGMAAAIGYSVAEALIPKQTVTNTQNEVGNFLGLPGKQGGHIVGGPQAVNDRNQKAAIDRARDAIETARIATVSAQRSGTSQIVSAIRGIRFPTTLQATIRLRSIAAATSSGTTLVRIGGPANQGALNGM